MADKKNSQEYWNKRAQQDKLKVIATEQQGINNLKRVLRANLKEVQAQIKEFYEKYGDNPAEKLSYKEFEEYKKKLKQEALKNPQDKTLQKMAKQDIPKYRIDRLRALEIDIQIQLTEATRMQEAGIATTLKDVGKVAQATTAKRFYDTLGIEFNKISSKKMEKILSSDWAGKLNWSERIWKDREQVGKKVTDILEKGIPQGTSLQKMSMELKQATNQSFNNAFRLIRTESGHIDSQVTLDGFKQAQRELGYEYYILDAFLDNRTSDICRKIDEEMKKGKKYKISEAVEGVNYPLFHPNCRTVAILYEGIINEDLIEE